ncbi:MAG: DUF721 domain-containing protein [Alphaproteobacteria bacterium]|nr:DUF721 domain-containing protein [Alphaproteobacteria bacterium]
MNNKDDTQDIRTTKDLQSLAQTLMPLTKKIMSKHGFIETDIITNWDNIVSEQLAQYCSPLKIEFPKDKKNNGRLLLQVISGAFALEISHREKYILDKINTYFGYQAVSSIKILQNNEMTAIVEQNNKNQDLSKGYISPEDEEKIKNLTKDINNQNLKEILIKLGHSIFASNYKPEKKNDEF